MAENSTLRPAVGLPARTASNVVAVEDVGGEGRRLAPGPGGAVVSQVPADPSGWELPVTLAAFWSQMRAVMTLCEKRLGAVLPADDRARGALAVAREAGVIGGTLLALAAVGVAGGGTEALGDALVMLWWLLLVLAPLSVWALWEPCGRADWGGHRPWREFAGRSRRRADRG